MMVFLCHSAPILSGTFFPGGDHSEESGNAPTRLAGSLSHLDDVLIAF